MRSITSILGACFWDTNAIEYSPLFEDANVFGELCERLYGGDASSGESCEFVYNKLS